MSAETLEWLNNNTLIGYTKDRGYFWHYNESLQNGELSNHYEGAIPVEDVRKRLFFWNAVEADISYTVNGKTYTPGNRKAIVRDDTGECFYVPSAKYAVHQYGDWLLDKPMAILDASGGQLGIGSAGLLQKGGRAWVQLETPDGVTVGGDKLIPFIVATTSHNGMGATEYKRGFNRVGCDNTLDTFMSSNEPFVRTKHTKNSKLDISKAREILEVAFTDLDHEMAFIGQLAETAITDAQFEELVKRAFPGNTDPNASDRAIKNMTTRATAARARAIDTWDRSPMVANIKGTAWGAIQTFSTVGQHHGMLKGSTTLAEKNRLDFLSGKTAGSDASILLLMQEMQLAPIAK